MVLIYTYPTENNVSIHVHESSLACFISGSVLGPLQFLIYINDLNQAIKVHHFADDTNLLYINKSVAKLNKLVIQE